MDFSFSFSHFVFRAALRFQVTCPASPDENYCSSHHYRNQKHHKHKKYTNPNTTHSDIPPLYPNQSFFRSLVCRAASIFFAQGVCVRLRILVRFSAKLAPTCCSERLWAYMILKDQENPRKCSVWFMSILKALYQFFLRVVVTIQQSDILASIYVSVQRKIPYRPVIGVLHASNHF